VKRLLLLFVAVVLVVLAGCQTTPTGTTGATSEEATVTDRQLELLKKITEYIEHSDVKLEALAKEAELRGAREEMASGPPPIARDLAAAQALLSDAMERAQDKEKATTAAAVRRLSAVVLSMRAELPAAAITQHVERAVAALREAEPRLHDASAELLVALDTIRRNTAPGLLPDVRDQLELAKSHVDNMRPSDAVAVLETVLQQASDELATQQLARAESGLAGAQAAVEREVWPVVRAELVEVDRLLDTVSKRLPQPTPAPTTSEAESTEGAEPSPPAEGETEAPTEAATTEETVPATESEAESARSGESPER
jgi:hypothetical protein